MDRRDQTPAAAGKSGRLAPLALASVIVELQRSGRIEPVTAGKAAELLRRHRKAGVAHPQRLEDTLLQESLERLAGGARNEHAQNVRAGVIEPAFARLIHQRQLGKLPKPLIGRVRGARLQTSDGQSRAFLLDRVAIRPDDHPVAQAKGQKIAQRQRPARRLRVVERSIDALENAPVCQLGQQAIERLVQSQAALFHQDQRGYRRDGLRHRGDSKQRVGADRLAPLEALVAKRAEVSLASPFQQGHDASDFASLDVGFEDASHLLEPWLGETGLCSHVATLVSSRSQFPQSVLAVRSAARLRHSIPAQTSDKGTEEHPAHLPQPGAPRR